jgi:hypothetical protein
MVGCLHDVPLILFGDFNIIRAISETTSQNPNTHAMLDFNIMIHDLELSEVRLNSRSFTWSNKRPIPSPNSTESSYLTTGTL